MLKHSSPVVIPPRTPPRASSAQTVRMNGQNSGRPPRSIRRHNPDALPPAVAALLAITSIPARQPQRRRKRPAADRRISMDELIQEWKQDDTEIASSLSGSPMDLLLGRVDESESDYGGSLPSLDQERGRFGASRSISSDSLSTLPPSLDYDSPSYASHWDNLSTPESLSRKSLSERREKIYSSPPKEDCVLDHPLLHFNAEDPEEFTEANVPDVITISPSNERFKSFKSNLTASLQALKEAAKSFSNFTAPSVPPEDLLTRSILSPNFTSEMRPNHLDGLPSPALRRYLNPQPAPTSPTELSMQLHDALMIDADADTHAPMIQMQTYDRRGRSSRSRRKTADPFSEAGRLQSPTPTVRQREPRENSDFLRVIVLEMNMRRVGKLDTKAVGKARIWLPPRKLGSCKSPAFQSASGVPNRWVGTPA
ncbi:uncharacterized protein M421DRAFT_52532 [Didymella exigua CBS 183.55]|uniref:Uncharacterized protein n=1 Tax=Didymella exigua CBS 183.55 TaxID=1150837 RepID=A0A6A5RZA2_9PLEO|nr:uncharacterized protein M421DRAFT_52532 [Didymella exigua CBS 183.55]KAF1933192.1 hypothetical protein M421DRAFT_52532 [Didymella exigua CBS 183.55]